MKIAIISDSHDNLNNLIKAADILKKEKIELLIHCGDFCAPFILKELKKLNMPVHCVFGNIDDRYSSTKIAIEIGIILHGDYAELELDNKKIAFTHMPFFANAMAFTGRYDIVFHGHNHTAKQEKINSTWLVNPGNLAGITEVASFSIYDTKDNSIKNIKIK